MRGKTIRASLDLLITILEVGGAIQRHHFLEQMDRHPSLGYIAPHARSPTLTRVLRRLFEYGAIDLSDVYWGGSPLGEKLQEIALGSTETAYAATWVRDAAAFGNVDPAVPERARRKHRAAKRAFETRKWEDVRVFDPVFTVRSIILMPEALLLQSMRTVTHRTYAADVARRNREGDQT